MPFGIQGITALRRTRCTIQAFFSLQCLSAFRASLPRERGCNPIRHIGVSNAFRHSGHHCHRGNWKTVRLLDWGLQCLSAFRASLPAWGEREPEYSLLPSPMPFGIQGITATCSGTTVRITENGSPMPFGIQGITALLAMW